MNPDQIIGVVQAFKNGKKIEYKSHNADDHHWAEIDKPSWNFNAWEYRVKPEPREFHLCDGRLHAAWMVVPENHDPKDCGGEMIKVREVME